MHLLKILAFKKQKIGFFYFSKLNFSIFNALVQKVLGVFSSSLFFFLLFIIIVVFWLDELPFLFLLDGVFE